MLNLEVYIFDNDGRLRNIMRKIENGTWSMCANPNFLVFGKGKWPLSSLRHGMEYSGTDTGNHVVDSTSFSALTVQ